ncbi:MAG: prepilin-type N-terminal cleavage/methylation domain-containing protein [Proteobacteria bacterium]|nr:prepilin-type N-terminal cleavage/methylation domain-containing protein [Pseudomonadota bacterium]
MPSGQKGFTIIEIAIVMIIIGTIIGFGASLVVSLTVRAKRTESKDILKAASESIVGFAAVNARLPIWGNNLPDATVDEVCEVITNQRDSFTQPIYYFPADGANQLQTVGSICGRRSTNLTVCRDPACASRVSNVAFVVATGSENANPQTGIITAGCPTGQTCIGVYQTGQPNIDDCTGGVDCPNYDAASNRLNRAEEYDDLVQWVTLNELKVKTGCQGPPLRIINNDLPSGTESSLYNSVVLYADGGVSPYTWSLLTAAPPAPGLLFASTATTATISGTPSASGAYMVTVQVRDNNDSAGTNDNIALKSFVITINPDTSTGGSSGGGGGGGSGGGGGGGSGGGIGGGVGGGRTGSGGIGGGVGGGQTP